MEQGEFELSTMHPARRKLAAEALQNARQLVGQKRGIEPASVTNEDLAEAFRESGFSEWDPELAGRVIRALASVAGFEHV